MGVREAFARLGVPPVPPSQFSGGTAETQAAVSGSPGSPSSPSSPGFGRFADSALQPHPHPALDPEARRVWADTLCRCVSERVAHECPKALGQWDRAWEIVAAPSGRLLDLLAEWERTGKTADQRAAQEAAEDVAIAWGQAAIEWRKR